MPVWKGDGKAKNCRYGAQTKGDKPKTKCFGGFFDRDGKLAKREKNKKKRKGERKKERENSTKTSFQGPTGTKTNRGGFWVSGSRT